MSAPSDENVAARHAMIEDQLVARGIVDAAVLDALRRIPRERFLPEPARAHAYDDAPVPIGRGQTMSQPYVVAYMTERLDVRPGMRVLDVGTGSGYQAAVLLALGARVFSMERVETLLDAAEAALDDWMATDGLDPDALCLRHDDGSLGWPEEAPFDRIVVAAAGPSVPTALREQLADGGRLVMPTGPDAASTALRVVDRRRGRWEETEDLPVRFVPLVGAQGWPDERTRAQGNAEPG